MRGANFIKGLREINQSLTSAAGKMAISARRRDLFNTINISTGIKPAAKVCEILWQCSALHLHVPTTPLMERFRILIFYFFL